MEVVDVAVQSGHLKLLPLAGRQGIYLFFSSCFFYKDEVPELLLHPIEAERLQTLPDNYTASVSTSQRLKALGNGWTVDVIAHILKNLL